MTKLCIVSHSGGLDSSTLMAKALAEGMVVQPITFNYGQTNIIEGMAQEKVWAIYKERYKDNIRQTIELDIGELLGSIKSQYQSIRDSGKVEDKTELEFYTPFRNLVFSSLAAMVGEIVCFTEDIDELYVGIGVPWLIDTLYNFIAYREPLRIQNAGGLSFSLIVFFS